MENIENLSTRTIEQRADDEIFALTDDHEFETSPGWRRRENGSTEWEPACCYHRPYMWPQQTYCGFAERHHRMRVIQGPVLIRKDANA